LAIGTRQRFTRPRARALLGEIGLQAVLVTYRVFLLFPVIVAARLPSMFGRHRRLHAARSDLARPLNRANHWLSAILRWENAAIVRGVRFPCGSSVFAVGRQPTA
jgi:hypothetical protein